MSEKTRLRLLKILKYTSIFYILLLAFVVMMEGLSMKTISELLENNLIPLLLIPIAYSNLSKPR